MPIPVICQCGKKLMAPEALRGQRARCPACGRGVMVPGASDESLAATMVQPAATAKAVELPLDPEPDPLTPAAPRMPTRQCPACGCQALRDDLVCPACGANIETGITLAQTAGLIRTRRKRLPLPPVLVVAGGVLRDTCTLLTPPGFSATFGGGALAVIVLTIMVIAGAIWSNMPAGRVSYLRQELPAKLAAAAGQRTGTEIDPRTMAVIALADPKLDPDAQMPARLNVKGNLALITAEGSEIVGRVTGWYDPGLLFLGWRLTDDQIQLQFELGDAFYRRLKLPAPLSGR